MLATTELECTLKRLIILENNVEDSDEKQWTHMVVENIANIVQQLKALEKNMEFEKIEKHKC